MNQIELDQLRALLTAHIEKQRTALFGAIGEKWIRYAEKSAWDASLQDFRTTDLRRYGISPRMKVLDLAAGCGQFIECGAAAGYEMWGVEPEKWKLELIKRKFECLGLPGQSDKIREGIGEALPFPDNTFDCVTTYQTLEHVQDPQRVINEMVRVTKIGGGIYIRCPDYRSTFEGHYRLPWLPLMPRWMARGYLQVMRRPLAGLDTIQYVTKPRILRMLTASQRDGQRLLVFDDSKIQFEDALRRHAIPVMPMAFELREFIRWLKSLFRQEINVNLFVRVISK